MAKPAIAKVCLHLQWGVIVAILFFSTVAFGGVHAPAVYVVRLFISLSLILQVTVFLCQHNYFDDFDPALFFPLSVFAVFLALVYCQYLFGVNLLKHSAVGTVNTSVTYDSMVQLITYLIFFMVCVKIASKRENVERLGSLIAVLVFGITLLGLIQQSAPQGGILWRSFSSSKGVFFGPFINQNHFGGFLALTFPLSLGIMHDRFHRIKREHDHEVDEEASWRIWIALMDRGVVFLFFLTTLTLAACFISMARVSAVVLLLCCAAYFVLYARTLRNRKFYVTLFAVLACSFLLLWWMGGELVVRQFHLGSLSTAWYDRIEVFKRSLPLFYQFPLFGSGLGTFFLVSPKAFLPHMNYVSWQHAHNDYLEMLVETGAGGFLMFIGSILSLLLISFFRKQKNPSLWSRLMTNQALIAIFCIAVMETADFHLKVPAVALLFTFQLALLFRASHLERSRETDPFEGGSKMSRKVLKWAVPVLGLSLAVFLALYSTQDYLAGRLAQEDRNRLSNLKKAVELRPARADLWYELGKEYDRESREPQRGAASSLTLRQEAVSALRKAARLSPSYAPYWYRLGVLEYRLGFQKEGVTSLERAVHWSPGKLRNSIYLLGIYLRESERTNEGEERLKTLAKAQKLYEQLQGREEVPSEGEYRNWMGDYYFDRLRQLGAEWTGP